MTDTLPKHHDASGDDPGHEVATIDPLLSPEDVGLAEPECLHEPVEATIDEEEVQRSLGRRVLRWTIRGGLALGLSGTALAGSFAYQNREHAHVFSGLTAEGPMEIPTVPGCTLNRADYDPEPLPPPTTVEGEEPAPTTTIPEEDPEDDEANGATPASRHNTIDTPWEASAQGIEAAFQYQHYFSNEVARYVSSNSGIEYIVFIYGEDYSHGAPQLNFAALEAHELEIYNQRHDYLNADKHFAVDCTAEALFERRVGEGRQIPIILPSKPAIIRNWVIDFDVESEQKGQSGFTMPNADFDIGPFDLTPHDEFIILTTGKDFDPANPIIDPARSAHELKHKQVEVAEGETYRLHFSPEEKYAKSFDLRLEFDLEFGCALPFAVYGDYDAAVEKIHAEAEAALRQAGSADTCEELLAS